MESKGWSESSHCGLAGQHALREVQVAGDLLCSLSHDVRRWDGSGAYM